MTMVMTHWLTPNGKRIQPPREFDTPYLWILHVSQVFPKFESVEMFLRHRNPDGEQAKYARDAGMRLLNRLCKRIIDDVCEEDIFAESGLVQVIEPTLPYRSRW